MKKSFLLLTASLIGASSSHAILQGYWNMDAVDKDLKLEPNGGVQQLLINGEYTYLNVGFYNEIADIAGTAVNVVPPANDPNRAVEFFHVGSVYNDGAIEFQNFNFGGMTNVTFSFAYRAENPFTWDSNLDINYRIGDGNWQNIAEGLSDSSTWTTGTINFGTLLDDQNDVDFEIRTTNWASIAGYLDIDNVQVNADLVPEPSTYALLIGAGVLGLVAWRRRK